MGRRTDSRMNASCSTAKQGPPAARRPIVRYYEPSGNPRPCQPHLRPTAKPAGKCDGGRGRAANSALGSTREAQAQKGNGGRHCCQPPLRRAKDLPVFVTWPKTRRPRPALDPGSPAQASLPIEQLPLARSPTDLPKRQPGGSSSLSIRPAWRWKPKLPAKTVRCSAALLGSISLGVPLCSPPRKASSRVALEKIDSSGASYRLAPLPLPKELQHCLPAEIGPLVTCRIRLPLPALGEAGTAVPITQSPCTCAPSRKSEK